jgi:YfiH family protein
MGEIVGIVLHVCSYPCTMHPSLLQAANLPVPHAFTTRVGGRSRAPFDSLNFGNPSDLAPESRDGKQTISENFDLLRGLLGCPDRSISQVHQVHGGDVHVVSSAANAPITWGDVRADAIVTAVPSVLIAVRVADCLPVLLSSADGRIVGAAHAGWRGIIADVVANTVREMRAIGATEIAAAIGPCITQERFEVGPEVLEEFSRVFGAAAPIRERPDGKGHVDLKACAALQLRQAGVTSIVTDPGCTVGEPDRFFSHRREAGRTGRMVGIIGPVGL